MDQLRPPPPPEAAAAGRHRRDGSPVLAMTNKEERNSEIGCLPDELVFDILLRLSAREIYSATRLVCRKWYHMIHTHNFIYAHLHHSTYGLLIQNQYTKSKLHPNFVASRQGRIEISKFSCKFKQGVWSGCNGLLLQFPNEDYYGFYIANPATKQRFALPPTLGLIYINSCSGIAYAAASMEYKVVHTYYPKVTPVRARHCAILTVGVDSSWRHLNTNHLPITAMTLLDHRPLTTEGFMHWTDTKHTHILTLNVETEVITQTAIPEGCGERLKRYLSTGRSLTILVFCSELSWEVWELKAEAGEWTKLPNIDLEAQKWKFEQLTYVNGRSSLQPVGWLNYQEVVVFRASSPSPVCFAYNVGTQQIDFFLLDSYGDDHDFHVHRDSLLGLGGC